MPPEHTQELSKMPSNNNHTSASTCEAFPTALAAPVPVAGVVVETSTFPEDGIAVAQAAVDAGGLAVKVTALPPIHVRHGPFLYACALFVGGVRVGSVPYKEPGAVSRALAPWGKVAGRTIEAGAGGFAERYRRVLDALLNAKSSNPDLAGAIVGSPLLHEALGLDEATRGALARVAVARQEAVRREGAAAAEVVRKLERFYDRHRIRRTAADIRKTVQYFVVDGGEHDLRGSGLEQLSAQLGAKYGAGLDDGGFDPAALEARVVAHRANPHVLDLRRPHVGSRTASMVSVRHMIACAGFGFYLLSNSLPMMVVGAATMFVMTPPVESGGATSLVEEWWRHTFGTQNPP